MKKQNSIELDRLGQQFFSEILMMILDLLVGIFILNPKWEKKGIFIYITSIYIEYSIYIELKQYNMGSITNP